jgi:hypothetical protein
MNNQESNATTPLSAVINDPDANRAIGVGYSDYGRAAEGEKANSRTTADVIEFSSRSSRLSEKSHC